LLVDHRVREPYACAPDADRRWRETAELADHVEDVFGAQGKFAADLAP